MRTGAPGRHSYRERLTVFGNAKPHNRKTSRNGVANGE